MARQNRLHRDMEDPVEGPIMVRRLNIDGDGQGDLAGHGGSSAPSWCTRPSRTTSGRPTWIAMTWYRENFGENFTVTGLANTDVCIGDRYRIGDAEFEVTQPRVTCFRVGLRLDEPEMPNLLVAQHRPAFTPRHHRGIRARRGRHRPDAAGRSRAQRR